MIPGIDETYTNLLQAFPPRPIKTEAAYAAVQARVDALVGKGELTADEADYLSLLGMLIERYEADHDPMPELRGVAMVKALMVEGDLRQRDLVPIFKTESIASAVLNGHRQLTVAHIDRLARFFDLPHALFFGDARPVVRRTGVKYAAAAAHNHLLHDKLNP
ncbi:MAG: transcriptional regulator [Anaerolineae bacterium]|nr:transcriptional regulator [Anaerolineae bacterium]